MVLAFVGEVGCAEDMVRVPRPMGTFRVEWTCHLHGRDRGVGVRKNVIKAKHIIERENMVREIRTIFRFLFLK